MSNDIYNILLEIKEQVGGINAKLENVVKSQDDAKNVANDHEERLGLLEAAKHRIYGAALVISAIGAYFGSKIGNAVAAILTH